MDQRIEELKHLVLARKKELEARLERAKADAHGAAGETRRQVETKLEELERTVKDGWEKLGNETVKRLTDWLDDTA